MARPIKRGLDYFPLDVNLHGKIEYIQSMYGMLGVMVIISLWQRIYENSYYIEYGKRSAVTFSKDFTQLSRIDENKRHHWEIFDEIVHQAVDDGLFCKEIFEKYGVLTSRRIQEIYLKSKEKSAMVEFDERYLLLSDGKFSVFSPKTGVSSPKIGGYLPDNTTKESKEKKSKVKESKGEESTDARARASSPSSVKKHFGRFGCVTLTEGEYSALLSEFGEKLLGEYIVKMDAWLSDNSKHYRDCAAKLRQWISEDKAKPKKPRGINNYEDTNRPDYSGYADRIIADMRKEDSSED